MTSEKKTRRNFNLSNERYVINATCMLHFFLLCILDPAKCIPDGKNKVMAVVGETARLPCELTPAKRSDSAHLVLWYKELFGTPIYSFDLRNNRSKHWMDKDVFQERAFFHSQKTTSINAAGVPIVVSYLQINQVKLEDAAAYRCRVDFLSGPTRNVKVKLSLIELPSVPIFYDTNGKVINNLTAPYTIKSELKVKCEVLGGNPKPILKWSSSSKRLMKIIQTSNTAKFSSHQLVNRKQSLVSKTSSTLKIESLERGDHHSEIKCVAVNTNLTRPPEKSIRINLLLAPRHARIEREWGYFVAGKPYNITCNVMGSEPSPYIKILLNHKALKLVNSNKNTAVVEYMPRGEDHEKFLSCRGVNPHLPDLAVEDQWKITVHDIPKLRLTIVGKTSEKLNQIEIKSDDEVKFSCVVKAVPIAYSINWKRNDHPIDVLNVVENDSNDHHDHAYMSTTTEVHNETLTVSYLTTNVAGNYTCNAQNILGSTESNKMELRTKYVPACSRKGQLVYYAGIGESLKFVCHVNAYPKNNLSFKWTFTRSSENDAKTRNEPSSRAPINLSNTRSELDYDVSGKASFGTLACTGKNEIGEQKMPCLFQLLPKEIPKISNCTIKKKEATWVDITCALERNTTTFHNDFRVSVKANVKPDLEIIQSFTQPTFRIINLRPNTTYRIVISANNTHGRSRPHELVARTKADVTMLSFNNWITYDPTGSAEEEENEVNNKKGSNKKSNIAKIDDDNHKNPIKLLPIVGILAGIVAFLVMVTVVVIVIIRNRKLNQNGCGATHISFSTDIDHQVGISSDEDSFSGKRMNKQKENLHASRSYEELNDVCFEGFLTLGEGKNDNSQKFNSLRNAGQHTDALVQSLFNEAVSAPIAIDKIIPSKLVDREMDNQSKTELPQNQWNIQPKQKLSSREEHEEDETALTKISRGSSSPPESSSRFIVTANIEAHDEMLNLPSPITPQVIIRQPTSDTSTT